MNDPVSRFHLSRSPFISGFILTAAAILLLHSVRAFADATDGYEYDYERTDVPVSGIKKGQKLGTMYLKQQTLTVWRTVDSNRPLDASLSAYYSMPGGGVGPGCNFSGYDDSFGMLRNTGTTTETVCNYYRSFYTLYTGLKGYPTHKYKFIDGQWYFAFTVAVPRIKLTDVVINDPVLALTHAGQTVSLSPSSIPMLSVYLEDYSTTTTYARSPLSIIVSGTPPAVFFPQQNTSHAVLPVKVTPSGDVATGRASLDMCLYDGAGLSDSRYMLVFSDENSNSIGRDFSMRRENGAGEISYSVSVTDPSGTPQTVANREPFYWNNMQNGGAAQGRLRYVQLPNGYQGTVPCVPSAVSVQIRPVRYSSLKAGHYRGKINILFTPST